MEELRCRDYQNRIINETRGVFKDYDWRKIAVYAPCGSGKSVLIAFMAQNAILKGKKVLILSHRTEVLEQNFNKLEMLGLNVQVVNSKTKLLKKVDCYCGMSLTIKARIVNPHWLQWLQSVDLILVDEMSRGEHDGILSAVKGDAYIIGFSATIVRYAKSTQLGAFYDCIVKSVTTKELVSLGFLTPSRNFTFKAPKLDDVTISSTTGEYVNASLQSKFNKKSRFAGIIKNYNKHTPDTKAVVFTTSGEHCKNLCEEFNNAGIPAKYILSNETTEKSRKEILQQFSDGEFKVIVNVAILDLGYDEPTIETVILDFATTSYTRFSQACGRGSRLHKGKKFFNVLDMGDNIKRFGTFEDEPPCGLWHNAGSNGVAPSKECPQCNRLINVSASTCAYCGYVYPKDKSVYEVELEELVENDMGHYSDIETFAARKALEGWSVPRILMTVCVGNQGNEKKAFMEAIKSLRTANGSKVNPSYWFFFQSNILKKQKRSR